MDIGINVSETLGIAIFVSVAAVYILDSFFNRRKN